MTVKQTEAESSEQFSSNITSKTSNSKASKKNKKKELSNDSLVIKMAEELFENRPLLISDEEH